MSAAVSQADRRSKVRNACRGLAVSLRVRGQWFNRPATALDFTREGIGVISPTPLAKQRTVFITLSRGPLSAENLVGVVHNCTEHELGYRLGIRFRTESELQLDRPVALANLAALYQQTMGQLETS
ncbi:MAG: PilZ domain-containing protein [Pseudomonadales bacterium]